MHTNLRCRWPVRNQTPFAMDEEKSGSSTLQRRRFVTLFDWKFGYFRLPCGHSRRTRHCQSRAGARHGMCKLTHYMAGERHGRGMLCVNRPWQCCRRCSYWKRSTTWSQCRCSCDMKLFRETCVSGFMAKRLLNDSTCKECQISEVLLPLDNYTGFFWRPRWHSG